MKPSFWRERFVSKQNNRGSAFVQALVAVGVVGAMIYYLSPEVIKHRQQVEKTSSIITARLALHSMVDFTLLGIKQRWCFSKDWMQEPCSGDAKGSMTAVLSHPRSVERILMKKETVDFLRVMGVSNAANVPLNEIEQTISIKSFSAMHPIQKIISSLKGYKIEGIHVKIERNQNELIPEYGREVYLKVKVSLLDASGQPIQVGSSVLTTTSFVGVYPREVGSFALLVAGDLRLDLKNGAGLPKGDAFLYQFDSLAERSKYPGLVFESPVFVNGSITLPSAPGIDVDKNKGDTVYTPVTFKEKVIMGEGPVMRKNSSGKMAEFKPRSSGMELDQFWAHVRQFGGFQKGVEIDANRDLGLDYLSGLATGNPTGDPKFMERCIEYNLAKYDLNRTSRSELRGQILKENKNQNKYEYRLGLTDKNRFNPQLGQVKSPALVQSGWFGEILKGWDLSKNSGAVAKYTMNFGRMKVEGEIPDNGTVTLEPEINLKELKERVNGQLKDAESQLLFEQQKLENLEKEIERANGDLDELQRDLERTQDKKPVDKNKVAYLERQVDNMKDRIRFAERQKTRQKQDVEEAQERVTTMQKQLAAVNAQQGVQPKIHISISQIVDPKDSGNKDTNPTFRDVKVEFENGELLVNSKGEPMDISFQLEAYDVSYFQGTSLRSWSGNRGWLFFNRTNGGGFQVSQNISEVNGQSRGNLPDDDPMINYDIACANQQGSAFAGTDWSQSFAPSSRFSWSFTNKYEERTNLYFDSGNAYKSPNGGGTAAFLVKSLAKDCVIKSSANFVTGFFTCEKLKIESRSTPLRIIGSFIVSNGIEIEKDAYNAGIRWSTIYHPMATFELRQAGVLKSLGNGDCSAINRFPVWHPYPSMRDVANLYRCNAISLRSKADPFRWTSVDPDCGLVGQSKSTMCKNRLVKFYVLEVSRESGI
ncbi:hypothetical protein [Bdellovibrio bacteriovorus]|uniref:hypothetical protein n=1 Tax=Bdellovibrio bacteriovorus TaxID=959 RepID=UPI0035A93ECF